MNIYFLKQKNYETFILKMIIQFQVKRMDKIGFLDF